MSISLSSAILGKRIEPQASVSFAGIPLVSGSTEHVKKMMGITKTVTLSLSAATMVGVAMTTAAPTLVISSACVLAAIISAKAAYALKQLVGLGYASAAVAGTLAAGTYVVMALGAPHLAVYLLAAEAAGAILGGLGYSVHKEEILTTNRQTLLLGVSTAAVVAGAISIAIAAYIKN